MMQIQRLHLVPLVELRGGRKPQQAPSGPGSGEVGFSITGTVVTTLEQSYWTDMCPVDGQEKMCKHCESNPVLHFLSYLLPGLEPAVTMVF